MLQPWMVLKRGVSNAMRVEGRVNNWLKISPSGWGDAINGAPNVLTDTNTCTQAQPNTHSHTHTHTDRHTQT